MRQHTSTLARNAADRWRALHGPWPAVLLAVLCYANTLRNDFAYDDRLIVQENPRIRDFTDFRALWLHDWWYASATDAEEDPLRDRLYRPLTMFTFALNYAADGTQPAGYHLVNLALHAAVCVLVWSFVRRLVADDAIASVAAVLFAVHPVHVEAVANVIGRGELLATLFLLVGLNVLQPRSGVAGVRRALLAALAFLAALLAKETAVCYPAVALLALCAQSNRARTPRRWWLLHAAVLLGPLLVYLPLRYVALEQHLWRATPAAALMNPLVGTNVSERVLGAFTVLGQYTKLLFTPGRLSCDYGLAIINPRAGFTALTMLGMLAAAGVLVLLAGFIRRGEPWLRIAILAAMSLASYVLISNTPLLIGVAVAERLMYWPSVPLLALAALGVVQFWRWQCSAGRRRESRARLLVILGVVGIGVLGLRSVVRNRDWVDTLSLAARDVANFPQGAHLNKGYAQELMLQATGMRDPEAQLRQLRLADQHLRRALVIEPAYADALGLRARLLAHFGHLREAAACAQSALLLEAHNHDALLALAQIEHPGEDSERHLGALRVAAEEHPTDPAAQLVLGSALLDAGQPAAARVALARAVALLPDNVEALRQLGRALAAVGRGDEARDMFTRVLALAPDDWSTHANLARLLMRRDPAAALVHAQRAYELAPDDLRVAQNLAEVCSQCGQPARALALYQNIQQRLPEGDTYRRIIQERIEVLERK